MCRTMCSILNFSRTNSVSNYKIYSMKTKRRRRRIWGREVGGDFPPSFSFFAGKKFVASMIHIHIHIHIHIEHQGCVPLPMSLLSLRKDIGWSGLLCCMFVCQSTRAHIFTPIFTKLHHLVEVVTSSKPIVFEVNRSEINVT